jgi:hypothetical protein
MVGVCAISMWKLLVDAEKYLYSLKPDTAGWQSDIGDIFTSITITKHWLGYLLIFDLLILSRNVLS